jgi:4-carboxymuconolactone decarboxylase
MGREMRSTEYRDSLRRLTLHDERFLEDALAGRPSPALLEPRIRALVWLAALIGSGGPAVCYGRAVDMALASGATADDLVDTLLAVAPTVGSARVIDAAPKLALGLGYDVEADFEVAPR